MIKHDDPSSFDRHLLSELDKVFYIAPKAWPLCGAPTLHLHLILLPAGQRVYDVDAARSGRPVRSNGPHVPLPLCRFSIAFAVCTLHLSRVSMQVVRGSLEIEGTAFHRTQFDGFCAELHKMREYLVCRDARQCLCANGLNGGSSH
jgi:hypothetical protein